MDFIGNLDNTVNLHSIYLDWIVFLQISYQIILGISAVKNKQRMEGEIDAKVM